MVGGGGDQAANGVGVGAVDPGTIALSLGTSGVVFAATDRPLVEPEGRVHAFCHAVPDRWHLMSVMLSAAGSLRWFRDVLAPGVPFEAVDAEAASVPAGSDGLWFLPYLTGERSPHPDPLARGAFVGLTVAHERAIWPAPSSRAWPSACATASTRSWRPASRRRARSAPRAVGSRAGSGARSWPTSSGRRSPPSARPRARRSAPPCWRPWCRLVCERRGGGRVGRAGQPVAEPGPEASVYAEALETYRALYPALRPVFHRTG